MSRIDGDEDAAAGSDAASSLRLFELPLGPSFFLAPAETVARRLLGRLLETDFGGARCLAEIVETEAYVGPDDEASHAHSRFGMTPRNRSMFGPPGMAYVYRSYGIHWCLNAVTGEAGYPAAVLIRAARPLTGIDVMRARRGAAADPDLLRGPGNLARALGVDGSLDGHPLDRQPLRILHGREAEDALISRGPRVGISRAIDHPLRFWLAGDPHVSRARRSPGIRSESSVSTSPS